MGSETLANYKKFSRIKNLGIITVAALGITTGSSLYFGCTEKEDNIIDMVDCKLCMVNKVHSHKC